MTTASLPPRPTPEQLAAMPAGEKQALLGHLRIANDQRAREGTATRQDHQAERRIQIGSTILRQAEEARRAVLAATRGKMPDLIGLQRLALMNAKFPLKSLDFIEASLRTTGEMPRVPKAGVWDRILSAVAKGHAVILLGDIGPGKTTLATAACWELLRSAWSPGEPAIDIAYRKTVDLLDTITHRAFKEGAMSVPAQLDQEARRRVLVLDEVQHLRDTDDEHLMLDRLIDKRYDACCCTFLLSNLTPKAFEEKIGRRRNASRWDQAGEIIVCDWPSFRVRGGGA